MARIYQQIEVEIDLHEFSDDDLVNEIEYRLNNKRMAKERNDFVRAVDAATRGNSQRGNSLEDAIKQEMFEKHMRKISINDLDQFLGGL